jgi:hypothetical protein
MLHSKVQSYLNFSTILLLLSIFFLSTLLVAQAQKSVKVDIPENSVQNFILGIQSENDGLKKNHIYFVGKYCIKEARSTLLKEFLKTDDEELKSLIAWSLFRICDQKCIDDLDKLKLNDKSRELKMLVKFFKSLKKYELALADN